MNEPNFSNKPTQIEPTYLPQPDYLSSITPQNIHQKYDLRCRWRTCLGRSWQKRPVRPFQLQLCQLLPVAASISASTRCMWLPVHFGVHFGVHFAFFLETWGEGKQDGRPAPWNPRLLRNRQLCVELFKKKTFQQFGVCGSVIPVLYSATV